VRVSIRFDHEGGQYIKNELSCTNVNILRLTVAYLNATINVKPETQNWRLELTGLAKCSKTRGLMGTGLGLAYQGSAGRVFGLVRNQSDPFLRSKPGLLAGYLDPLSTLHMGPGLAHQELAGSVFGRVCISKM